jgi:hypothetical protein
LSVDGPSAIRCQPSATAQKILDKISQPEHGGDRTYKHRSPLLADGQQKQRRILPNPAKIASLRD